MSIQRGVISQSVAKYFKIYILAKEFGWTIGEINKVDFITARNLLTIIAEMNAEETRQLKKK